MNKPVILGLCFGALATVGAWYYLSGSVIVDSRSVPGSSSSDSVSSAPEAADAPLVQSFSDSDAITPDLLDLIAHRQKLRAFITVEGWDKAVKAAGLVDRASTEACASAEPSQAIFVSADFAQTIVDGTSNVLFVSRRQARCYALNSKLTLGIDELVRGKKVYEQVGEVVINRIVDPISSATNLQFLDALKLKPDETVYLSNLELAPLRNRESLALHISFTPMTQALDRTKIPNYVVGAEAILPANITKLFYKATLPMEKPILVDARDRRNISAGPAYAGAIFAPFISSNAYQTKYRPDLTTAVVIGAKFDFSRLPTSRNIPLVIFGNDESDAAPLWVIRNLRLQNYRNLFYVVGGLKAMNELKQPIVF